MKKKWLTQKKNQFKNGNAKSTGPIILFGDFSTPPWDPGDGGGGGGGGGGTPTFPGNDPFPGGDPGGGGPGGGCAGYGSWMLGDAALSSDLVSSNTTNIDATHRTITYTWIPFKQVANIWRFQSVEQATQQLIGGSWQITGFAHVGVTLVGTTLGFTLQWTDYIPPAATFTTTQAIITLKFRVRSIYYCGGAPFEFNVKFADGTLDGYAQNHFSV